MFLEGTHSTFGSLRGLGPRASRPNLCWACSPHNWMFRKHCTNNESSAWPPFPPRSFPRAVPGFVKMWAHWFNFFCQIIGLSFPSSPCLHRQASKDLKLTPKVEGNTFYDSKEIRLGRQNGHLGPKNKEFNVQLDIVLHYIIEELRLPNMSSLSKTILFSSHMTRRLEADHQGLLRQQHRALMPSLPGFLLCHA